MGLNLVGGRKFIVVCGAMVMSFILAMTKNLNTEFAQVVSICVGAFMLAHSVQDWKNGAAK